MRDQYNSPAHPVLPPNPTSHSRQVSKFFKGVPQVSAGTLDIINNFHLLPANSLYGENEIATPQEEPIQQDAIITNKQFYKTPQTEDIKPHNFDYMSQETVALPLNIKEFPNRAVTSKTYLK